MSIIACFFLALIPYTTSITFNFTNITPKNSKDIIISGDASYTFGDGIQVNNNSEWQGGRATYIRPLHLWSKNSTYLASFATSFTYVIDSKRSNIFADGFTFFLAQNNSDIDKGGSMGLPFDKETNTAKYPFIAVEFDSYYNDYDPKDPVTNKSIGEHVGININSMSSVAYRKWYSNITHGKECKARINYHSDSKNLSVSFTSFKDNLVVWETGLNYTVDLRTKLPEQVIFGFSASTGVYYEQTNVKSWTFKSTKFKGYENKSINYSSSPPPTNSPPPTKSINQSNSPSPTKSINQSNSPPPTKSIDQSKSPSPTESVDQSKSPSPTESIDQSKSPPPTESIDQSNSPPPTKSIDQSRSISIIKRKNVGTEALVAGMLVLVFCYMAAL